MARMIDADALMKAMGVHTYMQTEWTPATAWGVPIVDAVEVVRCKDCRFRHQDGANFCLLGTQSDEWFCADGERKEDE